MHVLPLVLPLAASLALRAAAAAADVPSAAHILERASAIQWGERSVQGEFELTIVRPAWTRSLRLQAAVERPDKSFYRISAPAREAGTASLSLGPQMWNYVPALERTIRIPPSLALQPWLGSDITNDDVMQQSSRLSNYSHRLLDDVVVEGAAAYRVEALAKPDAPVAWERVEHIVRKADFVPLSESYFDRQGTLVRRMVFSDVRSFDGHSAPARWEARPADKPGHVTVITIQKARFDRPVDPETFTLRRLTAKP